MWALQVALAACLLAPSAGYFFEPGYTHHYTYWAENSLFDQHNITMVLKFQISAVNETEGGHRLHALTVDSLVQYVKDGILMNNPMKWDLSKSFLFVSDEKGSVRLVHCHPADHEELVIIKKAMVSVFSVSVQIEEDKDEWTYSVDEQDHLGSLTHDYRVQQTDSGLKLQRKHYSSNDAFRTHEKTLHYDHQGTLHTAEARDHVLLRDRSAKTKSVPVPGEKPHKVYMSGDFPDIQAGATVRVTLDGKRPRLETAHTVFHNLTSQTLEIKLKPPPLHSLDAVQMNISFVYKCLETYPEKDHENRSICVNEFRDLLTHMHKDDYVKFVNASLAARCQWNDTVCEDRRLVLIDVVARLGDVTSQDLLISHVLTRDPPVGEELRRVFLHCVAMIDPTESFINAVEKFCFGAEGEQHGTRAMNRTQSRACLAVGSLARHCHRAGHHDKADRLVDHLESWLDHHEKGDHVISKRDTWLEETEHEDHHVSKAILLHALGNAAMERSRRHLLTHAEPNRGHQLWRRAALDAMRRYNCTETAKAMLDAMMNDEKHTVRQMALSVYVNHPRRSEVALEHENTMLSDNYTYPAVARVKRNMFDKVLFKFKIEIPTLDWKKELGSSAVGASFGIYFQNGIDALFRVLNGYIDVNVHDKLWAEVHLGIIDKQWYIVLVEACYKGRLSYNMNIVKDFTVNMMKDISSAFDHIANRIIEPMEKAANDLASRYQDKDTNTPKSGFEPVATAVQELPKRSKLALQSTVDLSQIADQITNMPLITRIQQLATRAQSLMEDVHTEATDLYANIKDAAVVALPFAEKEIRNSLNHVLDKLGEVSQAPRKVSTFIERAKNGFQLAMHRIVEGSNIIKQATAFLSGSRSSFMNSAQELMEIAHNTRELVQRLRADVARKKRQAEPWGDVGETVDAGLDMVLDSIMDRANEMADHLGNSTNSAGELQKGLDQQNLYIEVLKTSYQAFKEAIDMVKSRISALFGQKFHPDFPDQQRDCDGRCGCGYYPTNCERYDGHRGIDLKLEPGWKIVSPIAGLATQTGPHALSIKPSTAGFTDYEIILSNINIIVTLEDGGTFVDAGQYIAEPTGKNGCDDSHFHLAMKRNTPDSDAGLCYYVDPSPFINRMQPIPTWHQECKDFTFKHIGDTVDFSSLTNGFMQILEELKRVALDVGKNLLMKAIASLPDTGFIGAMKGIAGQIVSGLDTDPSNLKNMFKDIGGSVKNFFGGISSSKFNLKSIANMALNASLGSSNPLSLSLRNITGFIGQAKALLQSPPLAKLGSLALGGLGRILGSRGSFSTPSTGGCGSSEGLLDAAVSAGQDLLSQVTGGGVGGQGSGLLAGFTTQVSSFVSSRAGMMSALKSSACNLCPSFGNALATLTKSACVAHEDCLGIDCHVNIPSGLVSGKLDISLTVDPGARKVTLTSSGHVQDISGDNTKTVAAGFKVLGLFDIKFKVGAVWQGRELQFSLSVIACSFELCLPELPIVQKIKFQGHARKKRSLSDLLGPFVSVMDQLPLDDVTKMFSDFALPMEDMVSQITGVHEQIMSALKTNKNRAEGAHSGAVMSTEFKTPKDFKDSGEFPIKGENGELYMPFFIFKFVYPLGPVVFQVDFDAGGAFGVSFDVKVMALDSKLRTEIKPWVSAKFRASMSISIVIASAGIDLVGWVMRIGFPLTLTTNYNKQPVVTRKALEIELIPIELKLTGWVQILFIINIRKDIWHYTAPAIRGTIWEKLHRKDDTGPPRFPYCDLGCGKNSTRRRRQTASGGGCNVYQVKGRHPKDAAFKLEFSVVDEDSDLALTYAIGDYPGGTNVQGWTEMRGSSLLAPAELPCGVPLHFLVKARNSQGLETTSRCSIPTFDCTFPDGRVDAAYRCTSHPSTLRSQVILFEDSQLKEDSLFHGVGYSPSSFGHEVVNWQPLSLNNSQPQSGVSGDLRFFSASRPGRLDAPPRKVSSTTSASVCASECVKMTTCISFVYNQYLHDCELYDVTESASVDRNSDGHYETYERLGQSYTAVLRYDIAPLRHGTKYYVNADIHNVLGYRATLTSQGTMVDRTPPRPGDVGNVTSDVLLAGGCSVSVIQRCVDHVSGTLNHRRIIDGPGSKTVLSGNRKGQDMLFTIENYHAAANWDGFKDEECGIYGYAWSVGTRVCGTDVAVFVDPHSSIRNRDDWTYTGLSKDLHLPDGQYYVTVQAVSDIIHGGDLVTTVCHSTPFTVDTTPPSFNAVQEFLFDDTFRYLVVYYNVSDDISGIARMEFGLGRTKYDVEIRRYLTFEMRGVQGNTYLVNEEFETEDGVPAWIRLKVVNNVGLSATGSSDSPILLDSTPPFAGRVMDGAELGRDVCCQNVTTQVCAQWVDFYDPDSSIDSYDWGVGLSPGKDDVVTYTRLSSYTKQKCVTVQLHHNVTYFSTIVANNKALNTKSANSTSDGLLVDVTPPVAGSIADGSDVAHDVNYTSETATVTASWADFYDRESGVRDYTVAVIVNDALDKRFPGLSQSATTFTDHSFSLQHGDVVTVELLTSNRAGSSVATTTDGMLVDHTPPQLVDLGTENRTRYQLRDDVLDFAFEFLDPESGISEYRCVVYQMHQGIKSKFWPAQTDYYLIRLNGTSSTAEQLRLAGQRLQNGGAYSVKVTAMNRARLSRAEESESVTVDTTAPVILGVSLSRQGEEEEINDQGEVEHVDQEPLWINWTPQDSESNVKETRLCVGLVGSSDCLTTVGQYQSVDGTSPSTVVLRDLPLEVSSEDRKVLYQVYVVVYNGAGMLSSVSTSRPFLVLKANVAGTVLDGRSFTDDLAFSHDKASIAITFSGFSSEACGIVGYEWGIGTSPFATDVLPYSDYGLVMIDEDRAVGFAQAHVMVFEGQTYYSVVRARTGSSCHEEFIVSASNGFTVDTTPPAVSFTFEKRPVWSQDVVYQTSSNHLQVVWKAEDPSGINGTRLVRDAFDHDSSVLSEQLPLSDSPGSGESRSFGLRVTDRAGNEMVSRLPHVTFDFSAPEFIDLACTPVVSSLSTLLSCAWDRVEEEQSALSEIRVGLGSGPSVANLVNMTLLPPTSRRWSFDLWDIFVSPGSFAHFYVIFVAANAAGNETILPVRVVNDLTPPTVQEVIVVTSPRAGFHDVRQRCQTAEDYVEVLVTRIEDKESEIKSVELALGSSKGRSDIVPFRNVRVIDGMYVMERLTLSPGATVYVTAKVTNSAGRYVIATSDFVVISPQPRLEVWDGPGDVDLDGQLQLHLLEGGWRYSDPCPVLLAEWSVVELGGLVVTNFTAILDNGRRLYNDGLHLENFKTYVNYVRLTDALNRTRTAYSDGITVLIRQPDTGTVRDGLELNDMDFQQPTDSLSANWDSFGDDRSTLPSDHIIRYEAAVGTDRRFPTARSDIHAFEDVGLDLNVTFFGLNLTAKTQTYYVTIRAYSGAGSYVESSSDGIKVGYSGDVIAGRVDAAQYQSSVDSLRFSWSGFDSDMVITHYYAGVSSTPPPWDNETHDCSVFLKEHAQLFDARPVESLDAESMTVFEDLKLGHGKTYYVTVVAADKMGHCSAATSHPVLVDTTPPAKGQVTAVGFNADTVIFVHTPHTLTISVSEFADHESGLDKVAIELLSSKSCSPDAGSEVVVLRSEEVKNQSDIVMRGLDLQEGTLYFVRVTVTNRAGLSTKGASHPVLLDTTAPRPGVVKLGTQWTGRDQTFQQHTDTVSALVALQSAQSQKECVTESNLLSNGSIPNWTRLNQDFKPDSVVFHDHALYVLLQHNPYLTGLERGAAQFNPMAWREGIYKFRLTPAVGDHIRSGVALTSPDLRPPFGSQTGMMPGGQSSLPCDPSGGVCLEDRNETIKQGSVQSDREYGTGLTFLRNSTGFVKTLFWAQDAVQRKQTWITLDFDPSFTAANYAFNMQRRRESGNELWEVTVSVNDQSKASVSGLVFTGDFVVSVYGWNEDDFIPPVTDPFHPFRAITTLHALTLPLPQRPLCSYGDAFSDVVSDVREVWVGVSDAYNVTANVEPFRLLRSFCVPCLLGCQEICSQGCQGSGQLLGDFTVFPLKLQGLKLQAGDEVFKNTSLNTGNSSASTFNGTQFENDVVLNNTKAEMNRYQLPTYYLDVRIVDHSGLDTTVKSPGLVIDSSPPYFRSLSCFNPEFSKDVVIDLLGNNNTVGVTWEVAEDISDITELKVGLGTKPGLDNLVAMVAVDSKQIQYVFADLFHLLRDNVTYYVTARAQNQAGLTGQASTNVTVMTSPPDVTAVALSMPNVTTVTIGGAEVGLVENSDNLQLDLDLGPVSGVDVEYFELEIGTNLATDDIFPKTVVGQRSSKKVVIKAGYVLRDESPKKISVGDYTKRNISTNDLPDLGANLFRMEPGRCLRQQLYGVSKAHVATAFNVIPICVKRPGDTLLEADGRLHVLTMNGSVFDKDQAPTTNTDSLKLQLKLKKGGIMVGVLTTSDLSQQYGTSASAQFSPFVVVPNNTLDQTSRWLRKRLIETPGPNMYMSPLAEAEFDSDVVVTYLVPASVHIPADSVVSIVLWNAESQQWKAPEEVCLTSSQGFNNATRLVTAKLCSSLFSIDPAVSEASTTPAGRRKKRSTTSTQQVLNATTQGPRLVSISIVSNLTVNQPPVMGNTTFSLPEDTTFTVSLTYSDPERDVVTFWLSGQPGRGQATVAQDGSVSYTPDRDFNGVDTISVTGKEVLASNAQALGLVPNVISFTVTFYVTGVNDPPALAYLPDNNTATVRQEKAVGPTAGNGQNVTIYVEANKTSGAAPLGFIVYYDVDANDIVTYSKITKVFPGADFVEIDVNPNNQRLADITLLTTSVTTATPLLKGKDVSLNLSDTKVSGQVTYDARVRDASGIFSRQLTLNAFILVNPCYHGDCQPRDPTGTCYEPRRAYGFDQYVCSCDPGYEGEWCQTETDECRTATCSPITDCVDLVANYRCDVNGAKMAAIIVCSVLALGLVAFGIFRLKKRNSKVGLWSPFLVATDDDDLKKPAKLLPDSLDTFRTVSDISLNGEPSAGDARKRSTGAEFDFMKDPLFLFRPTFNPTAKGLINPAFQPESGTAASSSAPSSTVLSKGKKAKKGKTSRKNAASTKKSKKTTKKSDSNMGQLLKDDSDTASLEMDLPPSCQPSRSHTGDSMSTTINMDEGLNRVDVATPRRPSTAGSSGHGLITTGLLGREMNPQPQ